MAIGRVLRIARRRRRGLVLTPLVPSFFLGLIYLFSLDAFSYHSFNAFLYPFFGAVIGYPVSLLLLAILGLPAAALLKRAGRKEWWAFGAAGLFIGMALGFFFSRTLLGGFDSFTLVGGCSAGFLTGFTYWFFAVRGEEKEETND